MLSIACHCRKMPCEDYGSSFVPSFVPMGCLHITQRRMADISSMYSVLVLLSDTPITDCAILFPGAVRRFGLEFSIVLSYDASPVKVSPTSRPLQCSSHRQHPHTALQHFLCMFAEDTSDSEVQREEARGGRACRLLPRRCISHHDGKRPPSQAF